MYTVWIDKIDEVYFYLDLIYLSRWHSVVIANKQFVKNFNDKHAILNGFTLIYTSIM